MKNQLENRIIKQKNIYLILILFFCTIFVFFIAISNGSYSISFIDFIFQKNTDLERIILYEIRIPRVLLSFFVGSALSISGASLQGLFRNPLAEPGLIGVSAGAALGAATSIVIGSYVFNETIQRFMLPISAIIASILVYIFANLIGRPSQKHGIPFPVLLRLSMGINGARYVGILRGIVDVFEEIIELDLRAS